MNYTNLSDNIKLFDRLIQSKDNTVWLTEDWKMIYINNVICHVKIWFKDLPELMNYDYRIKEILYMYNNWL